MPAYALCNWCSKSHLDGYGKLVVGEVIMLSKLMSHDTVTATALATKVKINTRFSERRTTSATPSYPTKVLHERTRLK